MAVGCFCVAVLCLRQSLASAQPRSWLPPLLQSRLGEASQPKTRTKLGQLLQHAARGVLGNPTGAHVAHR